MIFLVPEGNLSKSYLYKSAKLQSTDVARERITFRDKVSPSVSAIFFFKIT